MSLTKRIAKFLTGNREVRDPLGIFNLIVRDLTPFLPGVKFYAVGSRVKERGVKNDFDLMVVGFNEADFMAGELVTASVKAFVQANKKYYTHKESDQTSKVIGVLRHRFIPVFENRWATYKDEYGNPVMVDIMFSDGPPPTEAIQIETS